MSKSHIISNCPLDHKEPPLSRGNSQTTLMRLFKSPSI